MIFDKRDEKSMMMKRQEQMMRSGVKPKEKKLREEEEEGNKIISVGKMYEREKSWIDMIVLFFFLSRLRQPDTNLTQMNS